jgi:[protein-PII] uridylyltransferase
MGRILINHSNHNNENLCCPAVLKHTLQELKRSLGDDCFKHSNIATITYKLNTVIDEILIRLFEHHALDVNNQFCLLALGSYGRRELQLHSDIDLLILHLETTDRAEINNAQHFIQDCWDLGLEVSHQITTVNACSLLASQDITVISSLIDMHLLIGRASLMEDLLYQIHPLHMWSSHDYYFAKLEEQRKRYEKYNETAYNLEPNVKYGPGGLRDLQIVSQVSKRHFNIKKLADGIQYGFITDKEHEEFFHCLHFLWRIRFALHTLAEKNEERLLFDYQIKLAKLFGYEDKPHALAIEQFMKNYFKIIKRGRELNEMLLQWFREAIVHREKQVLLPLDSSFQLSNHYIEVRHEKIFAQHPVALLTIFLWIANDPSIEGIRASTIRLIRQHLYLLDNFFCASKPATSTFLAILRTSRSPYRALRRMSRYGVLGHYLDSFAKVTGQMQYDLFHVYTVDQHTLFVVRNISRFLLSQYKTTFPLCAQLMQNLQHRDILYLAALFHDIAKGRGDDHSKLGAKEAHKFAVRHELSEHEQSLLIWLVKHHLLMSQTAQRQDIYDPKTIAQFCRLIPQKEYLDHLYLLTVADICATNPTLWNAWKDSLLRELYLSAAGLIEQENTVLDESNIISRRKKEALAFLAKADISKEAAYNLWINFEGKYFLHEPAEIIAEHTKAILQATTFPLVLIMPHHTQGGTEVFIYMPHRDERFTITTTVLSNQQATIQEASIQTTHNSFDIDTYIILDEKNQALFDDHRRANIKQALEMHLKDTTTLPTTIERRLSRAQAHFSFAPTITFNDDNENQHTCVFLVTSDRPGLLSIISNIFLTEKINLHNAKIATAGERAEDMFYITNYQNLKLSTSEQDHLRIKLLDMLMTKYT